MDEHINLLAKNCLSLFDKNNIDYTFMERKNTIETELPSLDFNVIVNMDTICMLLGIDPLAFKLRGDLVIPNTRIEVSLFEDFAQIKSKIFRLPLGNKGPFGLFDIINNHNINSLYNKAYINPDGVQLSSEYNIQTYTYHPEDTMKYNLNYISEIIVMLTVNIIKDIYNIYLENDRLIRI